MLGQSFKIFFNDQCLSFITYKCFTIVLLCYSGPFETQEDSNTVAGNKGGNRIGETSPYFNPGRAESTRPYRHCLLLYFDFCFNGVTQFLTKKEFEIFWGNSPLGPLNFSEFQFFRSDPKWTPITQHFCGRVTKYYLRGCLQNTRAQNIEIWQNGSNCWKNKFFEIFLQFDFGRFAKMLSFILILASWT